MDRRPQWIDHPIAKIAATIVLSEIFGVFWTVAYGHFYWHVVTSVLIGGVVGVYVFVIRKGLDSDQDTTKSPQ